MPLVRVSLRQGKSPDYRRALADGLYAAMRDAFDVPDEDRFIVIHQHDDADFVYSSNYMQIARSDNLIIIQLTANNTRTVEQKKAFMQAVVSRLGAAPGVKPSDIFINIVEVAKENWSFGDGVAQYA